MDIIGQFCRFPTPVPAGSGSKGCPIDGTLSSYDAPSVLLDLYENNNLFARKSTDKLKILILRFDLSCLFRIGCAAVKVQFIKDKIMSISERYRQLLDQIDHQSDRLYETLPETTASALRLVDIAAEDLQDWVDVVGEIPQMQLENKLSPVLLKAHGDLDRARVMLEKDDHQQASVVIWELEQGLYRLLNDL